MKSPSPAPQVQTEHKINWPEDPGAEIQESPRAAGSLAWKEDLSLVTINGQWSLRRGYRKGEKALTVQVMMTQAEAENKASNSGREPT